MTCRNPHLPPPPTWAAFSTISELTSRRRRQGNLRDGRPVGAAFTQEPEAGLSAPGEYWPTPPPGCKTARSYEDHATPADQSLQIGYWAKDRDLRNGPSGRRTPPRRYDASLQGNIARERGLAGVSPCGRPPKSLSGISAGAVLRRALARERTRNEPTAEPGAHTGVR